MKQQTNGHSAQVDPTQKGQPGEERRWRGGRKTDLCSKQIYSSHHTRQMLLRMISLQILSDFCHFLLTTRVPDSQHLWHAAWIVFTAKVRVAVAC